MPEDEGANGDLWNEQAARLFRRTGWIKFGDSNIDIEGSDERKKGLDSLFQYEDGFSSNLDQGVIVESKYYATSSFKSGLLDTWVQALTRKIAKLKNSSDLLSKYPLINELNMNTGVIAIWFHDYENYNSVKTSFQKGLKEIKLSEGRRERNFNLRVFVLDNEKLMRTAAIAKYVDEFNKGGNSQRINFYYPASARFGGPAKEIPVLNLEYIFSQFVFAKVRDDNSPKVEDIVFYFGPMDVNSFSLLYDALHSFDMISTHNDLKIITYDRDYDNQFRKIESEVRKLFSPKEITIEDIYDFGPLPAWMKKDD